MNLPPPILPRLLPPPVRLRAGETVAELARAESLIDWFDTGFLRDAPQVDWVRASQVFRALAALAETVGATEAALAAEESAWMCGLCLEEPEARDEDALEYCRERLERLQHHLRPRAASSPACPAAPAAPSSSPGSA